MQGGLLLRQRQGIVFFFSRISGSSSLTLACCDCDFFSRASAAGRSGAEPHPTATQAITRPSQRTGEALQQLERSGKRRPPAWRELSVDAEGSAKFIRSSAQAQTFH